MKSLFSKLIRGTLLGALSMALSLSSVTHSEEEQKVKLQFVGLDLATLAKQVERVTKRSFLFDENQLRTRRVTLQSETPISPDEFYRVFQAICQVNGLAIVPLEGAGINLEKIVNAQGAFKEPGNQAIMVRGEQLPNNDALISYLIKVKNTTPAKIMSALTPMLSPTGSLNQVPNTDLIILNDLASSIKRAEKMITILDTPGDPVKTTVVPITHLQVGNAQTLLQEFLQAISMAKTGEPGHEKVGILKDERLNALHLIGQEREVDQAEKFLRTIDMDAPNTNRTVKYYKLKNVPVKDIVDYVSQLLGVALASNTDAAPNGASPAQTPAAPLAPPVSPVTPLAPSAAQASAVKTGTNNQKTALGAAEIIPVEGLNTLVVAGDASVHKAVEEILLNLDKRKGQVLIEVAIIQVNGNESLDMGVDYLGLNNLKNGQQFDHGLGTGTAEQSDPQNRGFPSNAALSAFTGSALRYIKEDQFQVVLRALATKSNVSIVSQPLLLVNDNEDASFTTKVSEPTTTTSQGTATTNVSFNGFADATTSLKITPHISPDGYINLQIVQTFEEFTGAPQGTGVPPPKVSNNATTKVTIPDRQTIVIGGFTRDSFDTSRSGIPGLMQIPGLGRLFSHDNKTKTMNRLYLFVRPKILAKEGFEDLRKESDLKKDDAEKLAKRSKIKDEINTKLGRGPDSVEVLPPLPPEAPDAKAPATQPKGK